MWAVASDGTEGGCGKQISKYLILCPSLGGLPCPLVFPRRGAPVYLGLSQGFPNLFDHNLVFAYDLFPSHDTLGGCGVRSICLFSWFV